MGHAEALLLVDDQKAQILELDALLQQPVGPDQQVDGPLLQPPEDLPALPRSLEPAQHLDVHRKAAEPGHRRGVVLLGQHSGGHQDGGLLPIQNALHHRPEGHLRLAVAHVPAEEPVHGRRALHIPFDLPDTPELVLRLLVVEGGLELLLPGGVRGEGKARLALPLGVEGDEPLGQVLGRRLGLALLPVPLGAPQLVQLDPWLAGLLVDLPAADVLADHVQLGGGDV